MKYYLSLGSNLGDRRLQLVRAIHFLEGIGRIDRISSVYETSPVGMEPDEGNFFNLVLSLDTGLRPRDLLARIKCFEKERGRSHSTSGYRSRPIDIDILLSGNRIINEEDLVIPHPRMPVRAFVMVPLCEIAPECTHPLLKKKMVDILKEMASDERIEKSPEQI